MSVLKFVLPAGRVCGVATHAVSRDSGYGLLSVRQVGRFGGLRSGRISGSRVCSDDGRPYDFFVKSATNEFDHILITQNLQLLADFVFDMVVLGELDG